MSPEMEYNAMRMLAGVYDWCRCVLDEAAAKEMPGESVTERADVRYLINIVQQMETLTRAGNSPAIQAAMSDLWFIVNTMDLAMDKWLHEHDADAAMRGLRQLADSSIPQWRAEVT